MSVFVSGEMGIVKYIGATEFAEGTWLGVQLKKPSKQILFVSFILDLYGAKLGYKSQFFMDPTRP